MSCYICQEKTDTFCKSCSQRVCKYDSSLKIIHFEIGPLTGNVMLTIGLVTEAIIFALSAFEPVDNELDWSLVYPELAGGEAKDKG